MISIKKLTFTSILAIVAFNCNAEEIIDISKKHFVKTVYCDGIYDLAHYGHAKSFEKTRKIASERFGVAPQLIRVLVGINDRDLQKYKRKPIYNLEQRTLQVSSFREVDAVIPDAEYPLTAAFIERHNIDLVTHGNDFTEEQIAKYYSEAVRQDKYAPYPYEEGISTSHIIQRTAIMGIQELLDRSKEPISPADRLTLQNAKEILEKVANHKS